MVLRADETVLRAQTLQSERMLIGTANCDMLLKDPFLSRWHAQIFYRDSQILLEDLRSHNGVFLRIADELLLEDGDEILAGRQRFLFQTSFDSRPFLPARPRSPSGADIRRATAAARAPAHPDP